MAETIACVRRPSYSESVAVSFFRVSLVSVASNYYVPLCSRLRPDVEISPGCACCPGCQGDDAIPRVGLCMCGEGGGLQQIPNFWDVSPT